MESVFDLVASFFALTRAASWAYLAALLAIVLVWPMLIVALAQPWRK